MNRGNSLTQSGFDGKNAPGTNTDPGPEASAAGPTPNQRFREGYPSLYVPVPRTTTLAVWIRMRRSSQKLQFST